MNAAMPDAEQAGDGLGHRALADEPHDRDHQRGGQRGADPPAEAADGVGDDEHHDGQAGVDHAHRAAHLFPDGGRDRLSAGRLVGMPGRRRGSVTGG